MQIPNVKELLETAANADRPASERMNACDALMSLVKVMRTAVLETRRSIEQRRKELVTR